jgi:hypothetical protein
LSKPILEHGVTRDHRRLLQHAWSGPDRHPRADHKVISKTGLGGPSARWRIHSSLPTGNVHFPAELIPSDRLAYISLSRTDTEMPQLALAYETLRDEDKRREYDHIYPLIRQTPTNPPTTQRSRRSLAPPALQQPRAGRSSYNMSPEAHRNLQNAGVASMQGRDVARKMEERTEIAIERTRRFREATEAARITSYGGTRQARASVC